MSIRNAIINDLPRIVEIYNDSIPDRQATADTMPIKLETRIDWFESHHAKRPLWVVEDVNGVAGWLSLHDFYKRPAYYQTVEISIYISKQARNQGLAKQLLKHCMENLAEIDVKTMLAFIFAHNLVSLELFKKFGFIQWGYLPGVAELDQQKKDVVILGYQ